MSYPPLLHDTRKQNNIQPRRIAAIRDMSWSKVRNIHDTVSSIDRDRNYYLIMHMSACKFLIAKYKNL